ncbi:MAG: DUF1570 domain-containing protein [Planctomycetes bacterium]|nr:DUF1570 domain-containing protein [Planctomycetota bacterium]MBI3844451.1 DUF1570 domain-containing protein [Planctomycetota bacterium]
MRRRPLLPRLVVFGGVTVTLGLVLIGMRTFSQNARITAGLAELGAEFDTFDSPPFVVYTSVSATVSKRVADDLGRFINAFLAGPGVEFGLKPFESDLQLILFPDVTKLQAYFRRTRHDDVYNLGGFYDALNRVIVLPAESGDAYHEAVHLCLDAASGTTQPHHSSWVEEGMATYFARSTLQRGGWQFGGVDFVLRDTLRQARSMGTAPRIRDVLEAGAVEFSGKQNSLYYASAHLIVAWLFADGDERRHAFADLVQQERLTGPGGADGLAARLRMPIDQIERDVESWIESDSCQ